MYLATARLQTGCCQREVATELRVLQSVSAGCNRETGRVTERHRSGCSLATSHVDDRIIVNSTLQSRMIATQLQASLREVRAWARLHLHWTRNQWASGLFSDES
uniref:Uncharacterized protein n=1 Tax=Mola mola TaxID=94237 RepID=A0A3Q3W3U1_MOLML